MSTNLDQFGLLGILRIIQNPRRIKSGNYKSYSKLHLLPPRIFLEFSQLLAIFTELFFCFKSVFNPENVCRWVPPVGLLYPTSGLACQVTSPTWPPHVAVSVSACGLKMAGTARRCTLSRLAAVTR
jgi:hypothetical protein